MTKDKFTKIGDQIWCKTHTVSNLSDGVPRIGLMLSSGLPNMARIIDVSKTRFCADRHDRGRSLHVLLTVQAFGGGQMIIPATNEKQELEKIFNESREVCAPRFYLTKMSPISRLSPGAGGL